VFEFGGSSDDDEEEEGMAVQPAQSRTPLVSPLPSPSATGGPASPSAAGPPRAARQPTSNSVAARVQNEVDQPPPTIRHGEAANECSIQ
jgi:hypothetical protein